MILILRVKRNSLEFCSRWKRNKTRSSRSGENLSIRGNGRGREKGERREILIRGTNECLFVTLRGKRRVEGERRARHVDDDRCSEE